MRLYDFSHSSCSWRVRIALALKAVEYERVPVNVTTAVREQESPAYTAINPLQQVPSIEWEQAGRTFRLAQSVAIVEWLEQRFPSPPLLPRDVEAAAKVRELVQIVNAGIQPLQNNRIIARIEELGGDGPAWGKHWIARGLSAFEAVARSTSGRYAVGDDVTMADVFLIPQLFNARRYEVDLTALPTLQRVERACAEHPAFVAARP